MSPPATPPPTILLADVRSRNTAKSCYVTLGPKVYDVTEFLDDHPGGSDLILDWGGKDVKDIMEDQEWHVHSEAAYEVLDDCFVGYVANEEVVDIATASSRPDGIIPLPPSANGKKELANGGASGAPVYATTGMSSEADLSKDTDYSADYKQHKFLDLNKPLLMQVFNGGFSKEFYLEQVHRPRHYKGGASAPLFGNFLEPLSLTAWWVVPMVWLPPVIYGIRLALTKLGVSTFGFWGFGLAFWTIIEYTLHRFLFHIDGIMPDNRVCITIHFLLHGIHHYLPMDRYRLVMPPALLALLAVPFWHLAHTVFHHNWYAGLSAFCGGITGYVCYDLTHYFLHHRKLPAYWQQLKKYHLMHHFADYQNGFGVTSRFWDWVFGTELDMTQGKGAKSL